MLRKISPCLFLLLIMACQNDLEQPLADQQFQVRWGLVENSFQTEPSFNRSFIVLDNQANDSLTTDWSINFNAFLGGILDISDGYAIEKVNGDYYQLKPTEAFDGLPPGQSDTVFYRAAGTSVKAAMSPGGFFLVNKGVVSPTKWSRAPMTPEASWGTFPLASVLNYSKPAELFAQYPAYAAPQAPAGILPTPSEISYLNDEGLRLTQVQSNGDDSNVNINKLHLWFSGALWHEPMRVFESWLANMHGVELVRHPEEKPEFPHLELHYDTNIADEAYEIFNMSPELTIISASSRAGMQYGLATVVQALSRQDDYLVLPLDKVVDAPRFGYRGQMLDVSRNFHTKEAVLKLLDLMALFKLNKFHFHLTDDEGWRLAIEGLPELTAVGGRRGYTAKETDHLHPSYCSEGTVDELYGSGFYTREDFVEILSFAKERQIEVIPEFDLPGHARAAIKAMEAYAKRTGDDSYLLSEPGDESKYLSIQDYPDNTIVVCQESTYNFLRKVVEETAAMYEEAGLSLTTLHTGGDEVPGGVWTAAPSCLALMEEWGVQDADEEKVKNIFSSFFLTRFREILTENGIRTAGWEEIAMEREENESGNYHYVVNPNVSDANMLAYVWNSLGNNVDLSYRLANAGFDVVVCNVTNFYFDLAYTTNPAEPGLFWGGFVDTYKPWAFAPYDMVKTMPEQWYGNSPTEAELRANTVALQASARDRIQGIQGQLWSETVIGPAMQEHYLWPKMLGLAERAWSPPSVWEEIADTEERQTVMASDWRQFASRVGHYILPMLDHYQDGIGYRLAPPGAQMVNGKVEMRAEFPGLVIQYQTDGNTTKAIYQDPLSLPQGTQLRLTTVDGKGRESAPLMFTVE